jgi:hypothetical protein
MLTSTDFILSYLNTGLTVSESGGTTIVIQNNSGSDINFVNTDKIPTDELPGLEIQSGDTGVTEMFIKYECINAASDICDDSDKRGVTLSLTDSSEGFEIDARYDVGKSFYFIIASTDQKIWPKGTSVRFTLDIEKVSSNSGEIAEKIIYRQPGSVDSDLRFNNSLSKYLKPVINNFWIDNNDFSVNYPVLFKWVLNTSNYFDITFDGDVQPVHTTQVQRAAEDKKYKLTAANKAGCSVSSELVPQFKSFTNFEAVGFDRDVQNNNIQIHVKWAAIESNVDTATFAVKTIGLDSEQEFKCPNQYECYIDPAILNYSADFDLAVSVSSIKRFSLFTSQSLPFKVPVIGNFTVVFAGNSTHLGADSCDYFMSLEEVKMLTVLQPFGGMRPYEGPDPPGPGPNPPGPNPPPPYINRPYRVTGNAEKAKYIRITLKNNDGNSVQWYQSCSVNGAIISLYSQEPASLAIMDAISEYGVVTHRELQL